MPEHKGTPNANLLAELGYESRDIALPIIIRWLALLFVFVIVTAGVTLVMFNLWVPRGAEERAAMKPGAVPLGQPAIQARPVRDIREFRATESRRVNGYGWAKKEKGVLHIPIDRAMELIVQRGLPTPVQTLTPPGSAAAGVVPPAAGSRVAPPPPSPRPSSPEPGPPIRNETPATQGR